VSSKHWSLEGAAEAGLKPAALYREHGSDDDHTGGHPARPLAGLTAVLCLSTAMHLIIGIGEWLASLFSCVKREEPLRQLLLSNAVRATTSLLLVRNLY
jgi:hypothetical protein